MRLILAATAAAAILSGSSLLASRADAMTITAPAGMRAAIEDSSAVEQTAYVCYRHGWRRVCSWHRPHRVYRHYYPRARWGWRHRR
jgi:hypothetical protein